MNKPVKVPVKDVNRKLKARRAGKDKASANDTTMLLLSIIVILAIVIGWMLVNTVLFGHVQTPHSLYEITRGY